MFLEPFLLEITIQHRIEYCKLIDTVFTKCVIISSIVTVKHFVACVVINSFSTVYTIPMFIIIVIFIFITVFQFMITNFIFFVFIKSIECYSSFWDFRWSKTFRNKYIGRIVHVYLYLEPIRFRRKIAVITATIVTLYENFHLQSHEGITVFAIFINLPIIFFIFEYVFDYPATYCLLICYRKSSIRF